MLSLSRGIAARQLLQPGKSVRLIPASTHSISSTLRSRREATQSSPNKLFSTSRICEFPSDDPGGKPNDGSHPTVYDDFKNITASDEPQLSVHSMSEESITLSDGLVLFTPAILVNKQVFMWDAPPLDPERAMPVGVGWEEWEEDVWRIFEVCSPRPEIVILGTGKKVLPPPPKVKQHLNRLGIQIEAHDTRNACSTYNLLTEEERLVAAALIQPNRRPTRRVKSGEETSLKDSGSEEERGGTQTLKGAAVLD